MRSRSTRALCVLLSVTLAVNSLVPWYAYADDSTEVAASGEIRLDDDGEGEAPGASGQDLEDGQALASGGGDSPDSGSLDGASAHNDIGSQRSFDDTGSFQLAASDSTDPFASGVASYSVPSFDSVDENDISLLSLSSSESAWLQILSNNSTSIVGFLSAASGQYTGSSSNWVNWNIAGSKFYTHSSGVSLLFGYVIHFLNLIRERLVYVNTHLDTIEKNSSSQWGYGYDGTAIWYSNSPAGWLKSLRDDIRSSLGYGYDGTAIYYSNSPAGWLRQIASDGRYKAGDGVTYTFTAYLHSLLASTNTFRDNTASSLGSLVSSQYWTGIIDGSNASATYSSSNLLSRLYATMHQTQLKNDTIVSRLFAASGSVSDTSLFKNWDIAGSKFVTPLHGFPLLFGYVIHFENLIREQLVSINSKMSSLIDKLDTLKVTVSAPGVEARLDHIADLLLMAGAKDLVDSILGEFDNLASAALMGQVQDALSNAFPFCIPAVVKQMLGLLQVPAMPPSADFDIWGATMHLDFSGMKGFADVVGWVCRISFVAVLLLNTRRFIYTGVGT